MAGGMPLAFTQEDFLVWFDFCSLDGFYTFNLTPNLKFWLKNDNISFMVGRK